MMDRYNEIVNEISQQIIVGRAAGNFAPLERRLQELLLTLYRHPLEEIALYLRTSSVEKGNLPTWSMLLLRSIELGKMQGVDTDDVFYGLLAHK